MNFIETHNPEVALTLIPWLVPVNQSREDIYLELRERLETNPGETYVCVVLEGDFIKGMAIAYCRYSDVFIWQARKVADLSSKVVDEAFEKIKKWAREKGFNRISAIPNKPVNTYFRRWGFIKSDNGEIYLELK